MIEASVQITSDSLVLPEPSDYEYRIVSGSGKENRAFVHYFKGWQIGSDKNIYSPGKSVSYETLSSNQDYQKSGNKWVPSGTVTIKAVWYDDNQHKSSDTAIFSVNLNVNADTDYSRSYADTSNDNWVDAVYSTAVIGIDDTSVPRSTDSNYQGGADNNNNKIPYTDEKENKHDSPNTTYAATFIAYQSPGTYFHATEKYRALS